MNMGVKEGASSLYAQTACVYMCVYGRQIANLKSYSLVWSEQQEAACSDKAARQ